MNKFGNSTTVKIKFTLLFIGSLIALGTWYYTQYLVNKLQEREKEIIQLYANSLEYIARPDESGSDITFIFQNLIQRIDFPLILTDANGNIVSTEAGIGYKNIYFEPEIPKEKLLELLSEKLKELENEHPPIEIKAPDGTVIQLIYYGDSAVVRKLRFYPYLQILFALVFILIAYTGFNFIRKNEQSSIWVGMSKETAHQLGTPISSLMGWNEILRINYDNPDKVLDVADEISNDLERLNKITKRFSKIGSKPELKEESPYEIIENVIRYFERRLPQTGKNINISVEGDSSLKALLNKELFEWVIENLIKNALDAIESQNGTIEFSIKQKNGSLVIDIKDSGKGIEPGNKKEVFKPGYSTKKRGWGLGLSLSKRIIENYHDGKIFVKESMINKGTTFRIILKRII
ncbi:sensor histidine kinase [Melioribacter sp. Ez-97]|uniref:sensor histidine kinase n=1 Tax=Melioribacter sp. Ez-97 TaxID=3423434 RepID=UPI003EDA0F2C